jgi:eukaryotic-like serine/threonine-protein kinase
MNFTAGSRVGHHEIISLLGKGGMGEVYRARDLTLKRDVAIKVLPKDFSFDRERIAKFQREAEILASLNHPHIATVFGFVHFGDSRCLVLELADGDTLAELLRRGPIPIPEALPIAKQIADALESAHDKGIIHRDLKPANIKIAPDGNVKVLDFGLAKVLREPERAEADAATRMTTVTAAGTVLGTPQYMSPEQVKGKDAERASDVWAYGCVLYEMLTGRSAFTGSTAGEVFAGILKTEPEWRQLPAETPQNIQRLLRRCLQKSERDRLRDIHDARIEIDTVDQQENPARFQPGMPRRREQLAWTVASLLLLLLTVQFLTGHYGFRQWRRSALVSVLFAGRRALPIRRFTARKGRHRRPGQPMWLRSVPLLPEHCLYRTALRQNTRRAVSFSCMETH